MFSRNPDAPFSPDPARCPLVVGSPEAALGRTFHLLVGGAGPAHQGLPGRHLGETPSIPTCLPSWTGFQSQRC